MMDVVRSLRRLLYHPILDGVVEKGDAGIDNLASYLDLIGEAQFGTLISSIKVSISLAYKVKYQTILCLLQKLEMSFKASTPQHQVLLQFRSAALFCLLKVYRYYSSVISTGKRLGHR